ncbi:MAG: hypothetical protein Q7T57_02640 [Dehalococcoidales bacterium]|nr:hypothetical protein [Dehalococcoidales bacterium]
MNTDVRQFISEQSRLKLYLIMAFASLILLFHCIGQIKPVIVEPTDLFGLASQLTLSYWVGLCVILLCSIFAFLDREHRSDALFIFLLVVIGLFLFGIAIFSEECPRDYGNYYPSAEALNVIQSHHVNVSEIIPMYNSWPATQLMGASVLEVTGIDLYEFIRYFPLFWVFCFICITYSIGKRLKLPSNLPFLLSLFILSSYWLMWYRYDPPSIAVLLYLLCFMLLIRLGNTTAELILVILTFSGLIITHSITSLAILLPLVSLSIYRKQLKLIPLFIILFLSWYMFLAMGMFEKGVSDWWSAPWRQMFLMTQQVEKIGAIATPQRMISRYSMLAYLGLYGVAVIAALVFLRINKVKLAENKYIMPCIFWAGGVIGLSIAVPSGGAFTTDVLHRIYLYGLIPAACIILLGLRNRKLLVTLAILFIALHLPAHYGPEAAYGQVPTTELRGAEFFALRVKPKEPYFYNGSDITKLVYYYDPKLVSIPLYSPEQSFISPNKVDTEIMKKVTYILNGKLGTNRMIWAYGHDPLEEWLNTEAGAEFAPIYDNVDYQIYINNRIQ